MKSEATEFLDYFSVKGEEVRGDFDVDDGFAFHPWDRGTAHVVGEKEGEGGGGRREKEEGGGRKRREGWIQLLAARVPVEPIVYVGGLLGSVHNSGFHRKERSAVVDVGHAFRFWELVSAKRTSCLLKKRKTRG
jgi:hypothetical protein